MHQEIELNFASCQNLKGVEKNWIVANHPEKIEQAKG